MPAPNLRQLSVTVLAFGGLWYLLLAQLSQYWAVEPEYSFGWIVPLLGGYLFLLDWRSRPNAEVPKLRSPKWIFCIAGFALLPTWLVAQANPDWRLISWFLAFEVISISLCGIYLTGGTPWLKHFAFGICLILAAVPWPEVFQSTVIQELTKLSTTVTVALLNLLQIHAVQHGHLVELSTGFIGVDEACSGIQSFQAAIMLSLFLGELYGGSNLQRSALVLCSAAIALGCNLGRTLSLSVIGAKQGTDAIPTWHDLLGYAVLTICFFLLWGLARIICGRLRLRPATVPATGSAYPYRMIIGLGAWVCFTIVSTEIWYRQHETPAAVQWSFAWPVHKDEFTEIPLTRSEAAALVYDEGRGAEWTNKDGTHWVGYFFKWFRGPSWTRIAAREHRPEHCLPSAGYEPCGDHGTITVEAHGISIPFHALDFDDSGQKQYVFFCLWEEGLKGSGLLRLEDQNDRLARLRSVWFGQRCLGQQTLEIFISGVSTHQEAEAAFRQELPRLIDVGGSDLVADASGSEVRR